MKKEVKNWLDSAQYDLETIVKSETSTKHEILNSKQISRGEAASVAFSRVLQHA